jgi:uncharacterized damage-inducible protein DinB
MSDASERGRREVLQNLWEHHWWSVDKILAAARELSVEEFGRALGISYGSFHGALAHLVGAELVWHARVSDGVSMQGVPGAADLQDLAAIEAAWTGCRQTWQSILRDGDLEREVEYSNTKGERFCDAVWFILTHLVDHGAAYRGTLITALRLLGRTPPTTGLIFYVRQKGK